MPNTRMQLTDLEDDMIIRILEYIDHLELARLATTGFPYRLVRHAILRRFERLGTAPSYYFTTHSAYLEWRRAHAIQTDAWMPLAAGTSHYEGLSYVISTTKQLRWTDRDNSLRSQMVFSTPIAVPDVTETRFIGISAGHEHENEFFVAVTTDGDVYTWGWNDAQLGHDWTPAEPEDESNERMTRCIGPTYVRALHGIHMRSVAAGHRHCVAITESGRVFTWGTNAEGQCGHGDTSPHTVPKLVEALTQVTALNSCAGETHSLVVSDKGSLYSFGTGPQMGHGGGWGSQLQHLLPKIVKQINDRVFVMAAAGDAHSLALTSDGTVFSCGYDGRNRSIENGRLQPVQGLDHIHFSAIYAGGRQSGAVSTSGALYAWGPSSDYGYFQTRENARRWEPKLVQGIGHVDRVAFGNDHTLASTTNGEVWVWAVDLMYGNYDAYGEDWCLMETTPIRLGVQCLRVA